MNQTELEYCRRIVADAYYNQPNSFGIIVVIGIGVFIIYITLKSFGNRQSKKKKGLSH